VDVFEELVELGQRLGYTEEQARVFATGRDGSEYEAREAWSGTDTSGTVPSGLYEEARRCVAADRAAFAVSEATAWARVRQLVDEQLPHGTEAARRALQVYEARLNGRR
jgi:hypothetical protein